MAEVLGVFASGIAVTQLAGSIIASSKKIYTFWANVKDAPKNVTDLITEIELLGKVLLEYGNYHNASKQGSSSVMVEILQYCRDAMNELDEILRKMDDGMRKSNGKAARHWIGTKVALKGHIVQDLTNRLERAKSLLGLARDCRLEHTLRLIEVTMINAPRSKESQACNPSSKGMDAPVSTGHPSIHEGKNVPKILVGGKMKVCRFGFYRSLTYVLGDHDLEGDASNQDSIESSTGLDVDIQIQLLPKAWLKMKAINMMYSRRFGNWSYSFRPHCVIPNDSPVFTACSKGDQQQVIRLIETKRASVFDVSEDGWTLLHSTLHIAAIYSGRPTPKIEKYAYLAPAPWLLRYREIFHRPAEEVLDTVRVLVELGQCDPMVESPVTVECRQTLEFPDHHCAGPTPLDIYNGPPEAYKYLLEQDTFVVSIDEPHGTSIMERQLNLHLPYTNKLAVITAKKDKSFKKSLASKDGFPDYPFALHSTLFKILSACIFVPNQDDLDAAVSMASLLLEGGFDVHSIEDRGMTPFAHLFKDIDLCRWPSDAEYLAEVVMLWFRLLRKANYNLQEYLVRESYLHLPNEVFENSYRRVDVKYIKIERVKDSKDMVFRFEMYDYRLDFEFMRKARLDPCRPENMPGAWKSEIEEDFDTGLHVCPACIIRPTDRWPDFDIAFQVGELKNGVQAFRPTSYMRRRLGKSRCSCYYTCCVYSGEGDDTPVETHSGDNVVVFQCEPEVC